MLAGAAAIDFFGFGASAIVAEDAQQKFPLFGVPCRAQSDSHQQIMMASMMRAGDVVVVISNTGRTRQIVEAAQTARGNGGRVIGVVGAAGPVSEQPLRLGCRRTGQITGIGYRQRAQPVPGFARYPQRLSAGGQDPQVITGRHEVRAQPGRGR